MKAAPTPPTTRKRAAPTRWADSITCARCGLGFNPRGKGRHIESVKYCSRACQWEGQRKPLVVEVYSRTCAQCGEGYVTRRVNGRHCSPECLRASRRDDYKATFVSVRHTNPMMEKACRHCGQAFTTNFMAATRVYCSLRCSHQSGKARHRVRARDVERVTIRRMDIYDRDRGICGICRKPVDLTYPSGHPQSITLDHIIPSSQNGAHVPANVRLAHMICNARRGDRGAAQIPMGAVSIPTTYEPVERARLHVRAVKIEVG